MSTERGLSRRSMVRGLIFGSALAGCPVCAGLSGAAEQKGAHGSAPHWGYDKLDGPEMWGKMSPDWKMCAVGTEQTPIDLRNPIMAELQGKLDVSYQPSKLTVLNNGHTIQVNTAEAGSTRIMGQTYYLAQFHFHHPSEHLMDGQSFPLEIHFVHFANPNMSGKLAVIGVFVREGNANPMLEQVFRDMPADGMAPQVQAGMMNPIQLLPSIGKGYYRYMGSLTTPPCSEDVTWTVMRTPIEASRDQIMRFAQLFPMNARPILPLNRRYLLESL